MPANGCSLWRVFVWAPSSLVVACQHETPPGTVTWCLSKPAVVRFLASVFLCVSRSSSLRDEKQTNSLDVVAVVSEKASGGLGKCNTCRHLIVNVSPFQCSKQSSDMCIEPDQQQSGVGAISKAIPDKLLSKPGKPLTRSQWRR